MGNPQQIKPTDLKLLVTHKSTLSSNATLNEVAMLLIDSNARSYAVLEGLRPIGLILRETLVELAKATHQKETTRSPFQFWKPKPKVQPSVEAIDVAARIRESMVADPLIIEYGTAPDVVFDAVFERPDAHLQDDLILTHEDGSYLGNIGVTAVLRLLHGFLGKHMRELRVQKESLVFQHSQVVKVRRDLELTNEKLEISRDQALEGVRMKNMFLANMSHEIRTPMNGVFGMIDLLYDTDLDDDQEQLISTARSSAQTLMRIINDILDFSKIEAGKVSVEMMPFNIVEIVEASASLYSEAASGKEIELIVNFDDVPSWVVGDPHRYQQILNNLVSNAIKFTDSGRVEIFLTAVMNGEEAGILTEVKDSGIGITPTKVTQLFDPFTQADDSHARRFGGTGLGLSISKNLCDLLGGSLDCDSEVDQGTTFSFVLPFAAYADTESGEPVQSISQRLKCNAQSRAPRLDFSGMRVLLVEDNQVNQEVARRLLHKLKCDVCVADDGKVALEYLMNGSFDCVMMDCQMPVMDGYQATAEIRKGKAGEMSSEIFISAMTAHALSGDQEKCLQAGMDHYFSKPFGIQDFRHALELAVQKSELPAGQLDMQEYRRMISEAADC